MRGLHHEPGPHEDPVGLSGGQVGRGHLFLSGQRGEGDNKRVKRKRLVGSSTQNQIEERPRLQHSNSNASIGREQRLIDARDALHRLLLFSHIDIFPRLHERPPHVGIAFGLIVQENKCLGAVAGTGFVTRPTLEVSHRCWWASCLLLIKQSGGSLAGHPA